MNTNLSMTSLAHGIVESAMRGDAVKSRNQLRSLASLALANRAHDARAVAVEVVAAAETWAKSVASDLPAMREVLGTGYPAVEQRFALGFSEAYRSEVEPHLHGLVSIWRGLSERATAIAGFGGVRKPRSDLAEGVAGLVQCTRAVAEGLGALVILAEMAPLSDVIRTCNSVSKITKDASDVTAFIERTLEGRGDT